MGVPEPLERRGSPWPPPQYHGDLGIQTGKGKGSGVVDSKRKDWLEHLSDVHHSREIFEVHVACDHLSLLVFGGRIHNGIGHCQTVPQTHISGQIRNGFRQVNDMGRVEPSGKQ